MQRVILASLVLALTVLSGCSGGIPGLVTAGSGHKVTQELPLTGFNAVDAGSAFNVEISRGEEFKVTITADDNFMEHVNVVTEGSTLRIYLDSNFPGIRSWRVGTLDARVVMPELRELRLSGAAHSRIEGFTRDLDIVQSGGSWLRGSLAAGSLRLDASGASNVQLDGSAQELTIDGSGGSRLDLENLRAGNARVDLSGASSATVNVLGQLDYNLLGGARLEYVGQPRIGQADASSGASVHRK